MDDDTENDPRSALYKTTKDEVRDSTMNVMADELTSTDQVLLTLMMEAVMAGTVEAVISAWVSIYMTIWESKYPAKADFLSHVRKNTLDQLDRARTVVASAAPDVAAEVLGALKREEVPLKPGAASD